MPLTTFGAFFVTCPFTTNMDILWRSRRILFVQQAAHGMVPLTQSERNRLQAFFVEQLYQPQDYAAGLKAFKHIQSFIPSIFNTLLELNRQWGFKVFNHYDIILTLMGPVAVIGRKLARYHYADHACWSIQT